MAGDSKLSAVDYRVKGVDEWNGEYRSRLLLVCTLGML
jgi:hypothetical protein